MAERDLPKLNRPIDRPLIYILDDEPEIASIMAQTLARFMVCDSRPYETLDALLQDEHLEYADLLVIDINLSEGASGFDVPAALPIQCRFSAVLFVSGYPVENGEFKRAATLPFFDFISKPFSADVFVHRVNLLLSARLAIPPEIEDSLASYWSLPPFVAVVLDSAFTVTLCNQELVELLGLRHPGELVGRPWMEFIPREIARALEKVHGAVLKGDLQNYGEYTSLVRSIDGEVKSVRWFNTPFEGADGSALTLSIGIPGDFKATVHRQFREHFRDMLKRHRAAIRSFRRVKGPVAEASCILEGER